MGEVAAKRALEASIKAMSSTSENNKRIAKNTLMLYFRMLLIMLTSLYTSRVVLQALGVEDYGIYNVVGGIVGMFNIMSGSLSTAISRFITFELGKKVNRDLSAVFSCSVTIQTGLALVIFILAEFVGIWFINDKMNVSPERLNAAIWVFHFSMLTFVINLISIPYNAAIIAYEKMSTFAFIGIIDALGRLLISYLIVISPIDRLIFYALLMLIMAIIIRIIYVLYCKTHFKECKYKFCWDKLLIKQMFNFASWNLIGSSSVILRDHGGNIILNLFFGTVINTARGISYQIYTAIYSLASNIMTAFNPQITKSYAAGKYEYMMSLIFKSSRFSCYLLQILSIPILLNTEFILKLWLGTVPEITIIFVRLMLIFALSEAISAPLTTAQLATGKVKNYQLLVGGILLLNLPVSYILLQFYKTPIIVFVVSILISQLCFFARLFMLRKNINISINLFLRKVYVNLILVFISSIIPPMCLTPFLKNITLHFLISIVICIISSLFSIYYIGLNKEERLILLVRFKKLGENIKERLN